MIDTEVCRQALRVGVRGVDLLLIDRLAVVYRWVVTLTEILVFVVTFIAINNNAPADSQADKVPGWFVYSALVALAVLSPLYVNMRFSKKLATHRLASRLVEAMNLLRRGAYDRASTSLGTLRDRQVALRLATSELRNIRDSLDRLAWQASADLAILAGDRPSHRREEAHSRLGRLFKWVAERPYDPARRRALLLACGICGKRLTNVRIMEPLPVDVPSSEIHPQRRGRLRRASLDLAVSQAFLAGLIVGLISIGIQYVLKRYAGG